MQIAIIDNGVVGRIGNYRTLFPYTVFPDSGPTDEWLAENSCMKVNTFLAHDQNTQVLAPADPYIQDGWVYIVQVRDMTEEELAAVEASKAAQVRAERTRKLQECDWTQLLDSPVDRTAWAAYRDELRSLPEQEGFPHNVVWPTKPE
jgi:hypothetical protein